MRTICHHKTNSSNNYDLEFKNHGWNSFRLVHNRPDIEIGWHIGLKCIDIKEYWDNGHRATETYIKTFEQLLQHFKSYSHNLKEFEEIIYERIMEEAIEAL